MGPVWLMGMAAAEAVRVQPVAEAGALWLAVNRLQLGRGGSVLDLPSEAGQDRLFPTFRFRLDAAHGPGQRNRFSLTYQPLELTTRAVPTRDWRIRGADFAAGRPTDVTFGFSFFRASWQRDLLAQEPWTLALGANLQIRSSRLSFTQVDGEVGTSQSEFGPVPSLLLRARRDWSEAWVEVELDLLPIPQGGQANGFYEMDLRVGALDDRGFEPYLLLRALGGGFTGGSDGAFADSYLWLFSLGAGAALR